MQAYAGVSAESIDFPNTATTEIDLYAGIRPTFGKLALDFGFWDYYYPGGKCFKTPAFCGTAGMTPLPNGNLVKQNESFYEGYGKATYTVNDNFNFGGSVWGTPSVLNSGPTGIYYAGNVTLTAPGGWLPHDLGFYVSASAGGRSGPPMLSTECRRFPGALPTRAMRIGTPAWLSAGKWSRSICVTTRAT